jgi:hypothetical protein
MIVRNNGYWQRLIAMGKRCPKHNVGVTCPVNFDFSKVSTLRVTFARIKLRKHKSKFRNRLHCMISPGRY